MSGFFPSLLSTNIMLGGRYAVLRRVIIITYAGWRRIRTAGLSGGTCTVTPRHTVSIISVTRVSLVRLQSILTEALTARSLKYHSWAHLLINFGPEDNQRAKVSWTSYYEYSKVLSYL